MYLKTTSCAEAVVETSQCQWLFTSLTHGNSPQASLYLSITLALHLKPLSTSPSPWPFTSSLSLPSPQASLHLSMSLALHLKPLPTSPSPWPFTSSLSLPLQHPGPLPQASLHLSNTLALHLKPLSISPLHWPFTSNLSPHIITNRSFTYTISQYLTLLFPEGALGSRVHILFTT